MKQLFEVTIVGTLIGNIWWPPSGEFCKNIEMTFTPTQRPFTRQWSGLRDALLTITNDGDFQSCRLQDGCMEVKWFDNGKFITQSANIPICKATNDLLMV